MSINETMILYIKQKQKDNSEIESMRICKLYSPKKKKFYARKGKVPSPNLAPTQPKTHDHHFYIFYCDFTSLSSPVKFPQIRFKGYKKIGILVK